MRCLKVELKRPHDSDESCGLIFWWGIVRLSSRAGEGSDEGRVCKF